MASGTVGGHRRRGGRRRGRLGPLVAAAAVLGLSVAAGVALAAAGPARAASSSSGSGSASSSSDRPGAGRTLRIVQLGDSYSAGNGGGDYYGPPLCYRSRHNWGEQYSAWLRRQGYSVDYINNACSGTFVRSLTTGTAIPAAAVSTRLAKGETTATPAVRDRLRDRCAVGSDSSEGVVVDHLSTSGSTARAACTRTLPPQIDAVDGSTNLVLLTVGGNDVNFGGIVTGCFALGDRSPTICQERVTAARAAVSGVEAGLEGALAELRARMAPGGHVVLLTYPYLSSRASWVLKDVRADFGLASGHSYDAGAGVRALGDAGDAAQLAAAGAVDADGGYTGAADPAGGGCSRAVTPAVASAAARFVTVVDTTKCHFAGHEPDPSAMSRNPDRWVNEFVGAGPGESYHPNARGQTELAAELHPYRDFGASVPAAGAGTVSINPAGKRTFTTRPAALTVRRAPLRGTDGTGGAGDPTSTGATVSNDGGAAYVQQATGDGSPATSHWASSSSTNGGSTISDWSTGAGDGSGNPGGASNSNRANATTSRTVPGGSTRSSSGGTGAGATGSSSGSASSGGSDGTSGTDGASGTDGSSAPGGTTPARTGWGRDYAADWGRNYAADWGKNYAADWGRSFTPRWGTSAGAAGSRRTAGSGAGTSSGTGSSSSGRTTASRSSGGGSDATSPGTGILLVIAALAAGVAVKRRKA